jgi:AcrR family transcriptional regulator
MTLGHCNKTCAAELVSLRIARPLRKGAIRETGAEQKLIVREEKKKMPRHPDPDLEKRILNAAHGLWKRGGEKALTMRAVARAARTNTPAVYRRFMDRKELVGGLLRRIQDDIRAQFAQSRSFEEMAEAYLDYALKHPHEYDLFYAHASELHPPKSRGRPRPVREMRPNFALLEELLAKRLGGVPRDHTRLALALWAVVHGTATMLLWKTIPEEHEAELRRACRAGVKALIDGAARFSERN